MTFAFFKRLVFKRSNFTKHIFVDILSYQQFGLIFTNKIKKYAFSEPKSYFISYSTELISTVNLNLFEIQFSSAKKMITLLHEKIKMHAINPSIFK